MPQRNSQNLRRIRSLVGAVTKEQLRYVDCFVSADVGLFMPVGGHCFFAITPEHTHPAYMFILHFDDRTSVLLAGRTTTGTPGMVFALSPGIPHQEMLCDTPPRYLCVMIRQGFFERQYRSYSRRKPPLFPGRSIPAGRDFLPLLRRFMAEADSGMPGAEAVLEALGVEICHSLIRSHAGTPAPRERMAERVEVNRVIEHLDGHLQDKITVESLAAIAHLSPSHFSRVFRQETGKAPMEYVNNLRLERAKKLLRAGDDSISEIALACGFGTPSYLSASFQRRYKVTPREFQKAGRSNRERI